MHILAGAALAASAIGGMLLAGQETSSAPPAEAPDFFSFVRPLPHSAEPESTHRDPVPDTRWRIVFDRHLALAGEAHDVREAIAREAGSLTPEVQALLDKYLRYRQQMLPLQSMIDEGRNVAPSVAALQALRAAVFSASEREALFPSDESFESFLLARQAIITDTALSDDERHRRLHQLETSVPPEVMHVEEMRNGVVRLVPSLQQGEDEQVNHLAPAQ